MHCIKQSSPSPSRNVLGSTYVADKTTLPSTKSHFFDAFRLDILEFSSAAFCKRALLLLLNLQPLENGSGIILRKGDAQMLRSYVCNNENTFVSKDFCSLQ